MEVPDAELAAAAAAVGDEGGGRDTLAAALAAEFGPPEAGGMHALSLTLRTPAEHAASA